MLWARLAGSLQSTYLLPGMHGSGQCTLPLGGGAGQQLYAGQQWLSSAEPCWQPPTAPEPSSACNTFCNYELRGKGSGAHLSICPLKALGHHLGDRSSGVLGASKAADIPPQLLSLSNKALCRTVAC